MVYITGSQKQVAETILRIPLLSFAGTARMSCIAGRLSQQERGESRLTMAIM